MILTIDLHLAPRLRISGAVFLLPQYAFVVLTGIFPFLSASNYRDFIPVLVAFLVRIENLVLFFFRVIYKNRKSRQTIAVSRFCLPSAV